MAYWRERLVAERRLGHEYFPNDYYVRYFNLPFGLDRSFFADKRLLDVGCGPRGSLEWAAEAAERVGLDPLAAAYLRLGATRHAMRYVRGDAQHIPFPDGYFDVVSAFKSLDYVRDLDLAVRELQRVVRPGGSLLLITDVCGTLAPPAIHTFTWSEAERFPGWDVATREELTLLPAGVAESAIQRVAHPAPERGGPGVLVLRLVKP
jgi:SAM-dependent methyltransferase